MNRGINLSAASPKPEPPPGVFHLSIRTDLSDEALSDLTAGGYSRRSMAAFDAALVKLNL